MKILVCVLVIVFLVSLAMSFALQLFNWYIGVPQAKRAAKICPSIPEEYDCYAYYHSQIPKVWLPRLFK